jgi:hypothetical protein
MGDLGIPQPCDPGVEFLTVGNSERQVVQAGTHLIERLLAAVPMLGEPQAGLQAIVPQKHFAARSIGRRKFPHAPETEHFLVPGRARINVANRQPKVVKASDHGNFIVS